MKKNFCVTKRQLNDLMKTTNIGSVANMRQWVKQGSVVRIHKVLNIKTDILTLNAWRGLDRRRRVKIGQVLTGPIPPLYSGIMVGPDFTLQEVAILIVHPK